MLVGAERGKWDIAVKLKDGTDVTYNVTVDSIVDPTNPTKPGYAPAAMTDDTKAVSVASNAGGGATEETEDQKLGEAPASNPGAPDSAQSQTFSARPPSPGGEAAAAGAPGSSVIPSQNVSGGMVAGKFRADPAVVASGDGYSSEGVAFSGGTHYLPADGLSLATGTSQVIDFPQRMRRVSIADTDIADIQVVNPFQLNLIGHKPGFTTLTVWTGQGHYEERQVRIENGGKQQVLLNCIVAELDRQDLENQGINLSVALAKYNVSLVGLPGNVATAYGPNTNLSSSAAQGTSAGGILPFGGELIPLLLSSSMTYGLSAQNSNVLTNSFFEFLENHNLAKILAEPSLLANSGEEAKFLSGGEIPIVIAQALNSTIVFKQYGTSIDFTPVVVGANEVELLVKPEVSAPDFSQGVELFGFTVPAFVTRRAETLVRLRDNQTLIIAGLILHQKKQIVLKVPYLGDIPYISGFFKNTSWSDSETDLVISVTPQIVRPLPAGGQVYLPTARPPLSAEDIKTQRLSTPDVSRPRF